MNREFNLQKLVRRNVALLSPYSSARDEFTDFGQEMVFLDANENPFENGLNRYPDPQQRQLKGLFAQRKHVSINQILLGNGSDEVLDLLFRAFCEPGVDNVITLPPTYGMYNVLAGINAIDNREVLLNSDFQPDLEAIKLNTDENSKLLFLCSPNNPTGNCISENIIIRLLEDFPGLVIIDEAYIDFTNINSWIHKLDKYPNLIVTQTLSKAYAMAGIRLGICFASEEIIAVLNKIKPPYNVNSLTQTMAFERIEKVEEVKYEIDRIIEERTILSEVLLEVEFIERIYPSEANFILIKVDDASMRYHQLLKKGIVVRNRSNQPLCENTLRLTVGTKSENEQLVNALKSVSK